MGATTNRRKRLADRGTAGKNEGWPTAPDAAGGDFDIHIARDGTWFHQGTRIRRQRLVKLFATVLHLDENGQYWLKTPVEQGRILVDDAPFTAVELTVEGDGASQVLSFRTNVDDIVTAGPANPIRVAEDVETGEPSPYVLVRGSLEALITRPVFYQMVELAVEVERGGRSVLGVWSQGAFFELGTTEPSA
ncbi:MAG: DUF1285 domain-containing protein [Alphaproteobacteria bacterium]|nr:DUF1285 domain-containing protein [Alphaproteobacteria bacterium]